jgi:type I restriction enzyme R subunit
MTPPPADPPRHSEAAFEGVIEAHLLGHGYARLPGGYDRGRALFPDTIIAFIRQTQPKEAKAQPTTSGCMQPSTSTERND